MQGLRLPRRISILIREPRGSTFCTTIPLRRSIDPRFLPFGFLIAYYFKLLMKEIARSKGLWNNFGDSFIYQRVSFSSFPISFEEVIESI